MSGASVKRAILKRLGSVKTTTLRRVGLGIVWAMRAAVPCWVLMCWYSLISARTIALAYTWLFGLVYIAYQACWWWSSARERDFEG